MIPPPHGGQGSGQGVDLGQDRGAGGRPRTVGGQRGHVVAQEVGEQRDLVVGQLVVAEHGQLARHRHLDADLEVGQRAPPLRREERVGGGGADLAAEAGAHPEDRLHAVVDEGTGPAHVRGAGRRRAVTAHVVAPGAGAVELLEGGAGAGGGVDHRRVAGEALPGGRVGRRR